MYTTVARVLDENKATDGASPSAPTPTDVRKIMTAIQKVTSRLKTMTWDFEPVYRTEVFTACPENVNVSWGTLVLTNAKGQQFLLASATDAPTIVSNLQTLSFSLTAASAPQVMPAPQNHTPIKVLRLNDANNAIANTWYPTQLPLIDSISITGFWGYRHGYANAYIDSGDSVQDNPLSASATTMTVNDAFGSDALFNAPRFSPGNLLRIENELILVLGSALATLSVRRGVNGTTAAQHAQNTGISIWYPEEDMMDTVSRQAAYFYARRGAYEAVSISGLTTATYPPDMVDELWAMLQGYQNE